MAKNMLTPDQNGLGLGPVIVGGGKRFTFGGANEGFRCRFVALIEGGKGVAIMTNSDRGGTLISEVLYTVAREYGLEGIKPTERVVAKIDASAYEAVVGRYDYTVGGFGIIPIEYKDGRLWMDVRGQGRVELLPESDTVFFGRYDGTRLTFVRENGKIVAYKVGNLRAPKIN